MKIYYLVFLTFFISISSFAQVNVTATAGTPVGSYTTLKGAFDAINAGTHQGEIGIDITASTTETATALLDSSGNPTASAYITINIITSGVGIAVSGNIAAPLVRFNGADSINFNGSNQLTLNNTNTGGNTIVFNNDASAIVIKNMGVQGATLSATSGVISFLTGLRFGNDRITLDNLNINGSGIAPTCIWSLGTSTSSTIQNSGDTVRNSRIFDFFSTAVAPVGINLNGGNTGWSFTANSLYQTVNRSTAFQAPITAVLIFPSFTNDSHILNGNFVGGTSAGANGNFTFTGTAANVVGFIGMNIQTGGPGNLITNNIIRNVTVAFNAAAGSFTNAGITTFIGGYNGTTTILGNTVSDISVTNTNGSAAGAGIVGNGRVTTAGTSVFPTFTIQNNVINNFGLNAGGVGNAQFIGIRLETSASAALTPTALARPLFIAEGNTITNISSPFAGTNSFVRGIMSINTTGGSTARLFPLIGVYTNNINALSSGSALTGAGAVAVGAIFLQGSANSPSNDSLSTHEIIGNVISNLSATNTADVGTFNIGTSVTAIQSTAGAYNIYRNRISDLRNSAPGITNNPFILGVSVRSLFDTATVANNFISLGNGFTANSTVYGIINPFNTGRLLNVFYNSVVVSGAGAAGNTRGSAALVRDTAGGAGAPITTPFNSKNNILINERTGGTGVNFSFILAEAPPTFFSSDYNDFFTATATPIKYGGTPMSLAAYQTASGQDANSKSVDVFFVNEATADLHLTGASIGDQNLSGIALTTANTGLSGTALTDVNVDFDLQTRPAIQPYMGADEAAVVLPVRFTSFTAIRNGKSNLLTWNTAEELNTVKFNIERSNDGITFTVIGDISASGTGNSGNEYTFTDVKPSIGINYYRIKSVDSDQRGTYSIVRNVKNSGTFLITVYPNPVKDIVRLNLYSGVSEKAVISILDMNGKQLSSSNFVLAAGNNLLPFDMSNYSKGVYAMRIQLENETLIQKINKL